ncbi:MAG: hypothetical protein KJ904_01610 [Alphaproteobacteria bacterium]|nr:hypothetical protein [Alphaproteobacteria bacterium]MBU0885841.1 hypothetical protein [Alphaproteobacteria bacterium]
MTMRVGEIPGRLENAPHQGACWSADSVRFLLDLPAIGRFLAADGCCVTIQPAPGVAIEDILIFATGTAMAAILYQRGAMLLHGSAVTHQGRTFIFCGPSGVGKSTLAAALCRSGCGFISDDVCAISHLADGTPIIEPDGRVLRLYPDSIGQVGMEDAVGSRVRQMLEKFHVTPPEHDTPKKEAPPLAAIYLLADSNPVDLPGIVRLAPLEAAQALLRQSYRRRIALAYAHQGQPAARTAALLSRVGVYRLSRPREFAQLDETVARLRTHWDQLA